MLIRSGLRTDVPRLCEIEVAGSAMFAAAGMFNDELRGPMTADDIANLERHIAVDSLWVAELGDAIAAYAMIGAVDGNAHLDQVTVDPSYAGQRLGAALIEHAVARARERGFAQMTLTTYAEVGWNAPYYERLGFRRLADRDLSPGLVAIRAHEADLGLDEWPRVAMTRHLPAS